ncbi:MAG TPA: hypothetical protein PKZ84_03000 [Anaerolineae bacterium]|nr:hypothetical protein [Anaerolineae bacterium]HQI84859.1 hypothetical protein [Anaerolineae bacterium]
MKRQSYCGLCILLILLAACDATPVAPTATPTPAATAPPTAIPTPIPTWTPTLPPTPTPVPPLGVSIKWPERVSALEPPSVVVDIVPPPGIAPVVIIRAKVYDPTAQVYSTFDFVRQSGNRYVSTTPLRLSLNAPAGHWWLVVEVKSTFDLIGERMLAFEPAPIEYRALTDTLPAGVSLRVPVAFTEVITQGDQYAGGRVWQYGDGEIALWWAPGPTEALLFNTAIVMLEATHDPEAPPEVELVEETKWQGRTAFHFQEQWPGSAGGPAAAWVIQGKNYWLYVLRIRAVGTDAIPTLMQEIAATFAFDED